MALPAHRLLNLIYHWLRERLDEDGRAQMDDALADADRVELVVRTAPAAAPQRRHVPGTAPPGIRPPSWWKGDRAAFRSSQQAMSDITRRDLAGAAGRG